MLDDETLRRMPSVFKEEKLLFGVMPASDPYAGDGGTMDGVADWKGSGLGVTRTLCIARYSASRVYERAYPGSVPEIVWRMRVVEP